MKEQFTDEASARARFVAIRDNPRRSPRCAVRLTRHTETSTAQFPRGAIAKDGARWRAYAPGAVVARESYVYTVEWGMT